MYFKHVANFIIFKAGGKSKDTEQFKVIYKKNF